MWKKLFIALEIILIVSVSIILTNAQINNASQKLPKIQLVLKEISREYKYINQDWDSLDLEILLTFRNESDQPIIFNIRDMLVLETKVADNIENISKDSFCFQSELVCRLTGYDPNYYKDLNQKYPKNYFKIVNPGQFFDFREKVYIGVVGKNGNEKQDNIVNIGQHLLVLTVNTWYEGEKMQALATKLGNKWKHIGFLWSKKIISEPMPFSVSKERTYTQ